MTHILFPLIRFESKSFRKPTVSNTNTLSRWLSVWLKMSSAYFCEISTSDATFQLSYTSCRYREWNSDRYEPHSLPSDSIWIKVISETYWRWQIYYPIEIHFLDGWAFGSKCQVPTFARFQLQTRHFKNRIALQYQSQSLIEENEKYSARTEARTQDLGFIRPTL